MLRLKILQCPSVGGVNQFTHESCQRAACTWWDTRCTAQHVVLAEYERHLDKKAVPPCALATKCRWDVEARREGHSTCAVRRLGEICEHQGGIWNTFDTAPPEEW